MKRSSGYNTKQREAILTYIASIAGKHVTASQIVRHFEEAPLSIGRTTIYRYLEKLSSDGIIRKYTLDAVSGACYQYVDETEPVPSHYHLKCESCNEVVHLECDMLDNISNHILEEHDFEVNGLKMVFYGKCKTCIQNGFKSY